MNVTFVHVVRNIQPSTDVLINAVLAIEEVAIKDILAGRVTFKNHVNGHSKHFGEYEEEVNIETCTTILHEDKKEQALRGYVKL